MNTLLGVFGDSFACGPKINGTTWPEILASSLNMTLESHARPATSTWWSYVKFMEHHEKYRTIVFTYSQHNRWHHLSDECVGMHHINVVAKPHLSNFSKEQLEIVEILTSAYRYVASEELDLFIFQEVFNKINKICKEKDIKLINILPFQRGSNLIDYSSATSPLIANLDGLSWVERSQLTRKQEKAFSDMVNSGDIRDCHMSAKHNQLLATIIIEQWQATDNKIINICEDPRVSSDPLDNAALYDY